MRQQVPAFSIYLPFNPFPPEDIPADYALHYLEVLTLLFIYRGFYDSFHLHELVILEAIDAGAEFLHLWETLNEQLQERLEVRVWGVGIRKLWDQGHQVVVLVLIQSD